MTNFITNMPISKEKKADEKKAKLLAKILKETEESTPAAGRVAGQGDDKLSIEEILKAKQEESLFSRKREKKAPKNFKEINSLRFGVKQKKSQKVAYRPQKPVAVKDNRKQGKK